MTTLEELDSRLSDLIKTENGYFFALLSLEQPEVSAESRTALLARIADMLQTGEPIRERNLWGDKHPCTICGIYGYAVTPQGNTALCRKHYEWYMEEYQKYHEDGDE